MALDTVFSRSFAGLVGILVLLLTAAAVFGEIQVRAFHEEEVDLRLSTAADLLVQDTAAMLQRREPSDAQASRLRELGGATGLRLTVIALDGTVLADSEAHFPIANHADRPEIVAARATGRGSAQRRSATTGVETRYLALRVDRGGHPVGFLRAAAELPGMEKALSGLRRTLLLGGLVALAAGTLLSAALARRIAGPLASIGRSAMAVTSGHLDAEVRGAGPKEVRMLAGALNSMADRLRQQIRTERRARAESEAILASMSEGVVAIDPKERVLTMNASAARLLGLREAMAPGGNLWKSVRFAELEQALREALAGGTEWRGDAQAPHGSGRILSISVTPILTRTGDEPGATTGAVALLTDVTEIRRIEQMRIDFVANVSHEIRTPLAAIAGAIETLADEEQDADVRRRFRDIAARNSSRLQSLVADLLDLSAIEARNGSTARDPLDVHEVLRAAGSALQGTARAKGVILRLPERTAVQVVVPGDAQRLEQAFTNLIANAIQYTPEGGTVEARVRTRTDEVSIEIADTGIGIPVQALPRVFERFYRVDRGRSRDTGGTGLGLAIVKHIVRAHGGQVEVRSEEGLGSTFTIRLPRGSATPGPAHG